MKLFSIASYFITLGSWSGKLLHNYTIFVKSSKLHRVQLLTLSGKISIQERQILWNLHLSAS